MYRSSKIVCLFGDWFDVGCCTKYSYCILNKLSFAPKKREKVSNRHFHHLPKEKLVRTSRLRGADENLHPVCEYWCLIEFGANSHDVRYILNINYNNI